MALIRFLRQTRASIDSFDVFFGLLPLATSYAAFIAWANLIVRAIRGEEVEQDWRASGASAAHIAMRSLVAATEVRESVALRQAVGDTRQAVSDTHRAVSDTRQLVHEIALDAVERDRRAEERQDQLYKVQLTMAWVAGLTLIAAIVTLAVAILGK